MCRQGTPSIVSTSRTIAPTSSSRRAPRETCQPGDPSQVWFGFTSGRNQDAPGIFVAVAESFFPWISSGLVAHLGRNIGGDLLIGLGEFEECLHHQQVVLDCLRTKIGLDQGFFPGDQISISNRSGIIVPK